MTGTASIFAKVVGLFNTYYGRITLKKDEIYWC